MMVSQKIRDKAEVEKTQQAVLSKKVEDRDRGFVGKLENIQLDNLVQLYCLSAETITIKIHQSDYTGKVFLENGEIVHAEGGPRSGEEAFFTIMALQGGRIETTKEEKANARTIYKNYQSLLMEVARLSDESGWIEEEVKKPANTPPGEETLVLEEAKLKVLVADDSMLMRKIITGMLDAEKDIEVIGKAENGKKALKQIAGTKPDVVILDANMPVMDGVTTLKHIMIRNPCPVIVLSNLSSGDQSTLTQFFNLGAVDFLPKPVRNKNLHLQQKRIIASVKSAAEVKIQNFKRIPFHEKSLPDGDNLAVTAGPPLIVIVAGLGGYHEMLHLLSCLPVGLNSYFTAVHSLPEEFTQTFAISSEKIAALNILPVDWPATHLEPGHCYVASHESRIFLQKDESGFSISADETTNSESRKEKTIDDFISSTINNFTGTVHAVFLSGSDGIGERSIEAIRDRKGKIIVQEPSSSMKPAFLEKLIEQKMVDITAAPECIAEEVIKLK